VGTSRIFDKTLSRVFDLIREVAVILWVGCGVGMVRCGFGFVGFCSVGLSFVLLGIALRGDGGCKTGVRWCSVVLPSGTERGRGDARTQVCAHTHTRYVCGCRRLVEGAMWRWALWPFRAAMRALGLIHVAGHTEQKGPEPS
jgi:hypothetical protein